LLIQPLPLVAMCSSTSAARWAGAVVAATPTRTLHAVNAVATTRTAPTTARRRLPCTPPATEPVLEPTATRQRRLDVSGAGRRLHSASRNTQYPFKAVHPQRTPRQAQSITRCSASHAHRMRSTTASYPLTLRSVSSR
jgi:hypothetical protein